MKRIFFGLLGTIILLLAGCSFAGGALQGRPQDRLNPTALIETVYGQLTQHAPMTPTPRRSFASQLKNFFSRKTATPTAPAVVLISPTALLLPVTGSPMVSANVDTNCRSGPGIIYPVSGFLLAGEKVSLIGRNYNDRWWVVQDPRRPAVVCWVWADITTVEGDISNVPVISQPPTPRFTSIAPPANTLAPTPVPTATQAGFPTSTLPSSNTLVPTGTPLPTALPTSTPTFAPTPTPGPTATPEPTSTPRPTNTPRPTHTPKPTHTPRPVSGAVSLP